MGAGCFQCAQYHIEDCLSFLEYLVIPEPEYPKSLAFDSSVAALVVRSAFLMLAAVEFNHDLRFETRKIGDKTANGYLPPKSISAELPTP